MTQVDFSFTGADQQWTVPSGVTEVTIECRGAEGGTPLDGTCVPGQGGAAQGDLAVNPGDTLHVYVGEHPGRDNAGGFNGGGDGGANSDGGGGGGTDVRYGGQTLNDRVVVAGGGGGAADLASGEVAGDGGGTTGGDASGIDGGKGGTQTAGGAGGGFAQDGSFGQGGIGQSGGGGGGGWYGGGGGSDLGGGGGSGHLNSSLTNASTSQGGRTGHGHVTITYTTSIDATVNAAAPPAAASLTGELVDATTATLNAAAPAATASMAGDVPILGTANAAAPPASAALTGDVPILGTVNAVAPRASTSITADPGVPPTWQQVIISPAYQRSARAATRRVGARVDLIDDTGLVAATIPAAGGSVSCDSTVDERWSADISLARPRFMPRGTTDLLHPLSGLRVRLWWELRLDTGLLAEVPVGTFLPSEPAASHSADQFGLTIHLLDVISRIRRNKWGGGRTLELGGMTVSAALRTILADRAPEATLRITDTAETLPDVYQVGEPGRDPWKDVLAVAEAAAFTVHSDRLGAIVAEPRPTSSNSATVLELETGPGCRMESVNRTLDASKLLNTVTVMSSNPQVDPPVWSTVENTTPGSPLNINTAPRFADVFTSDTVTSSQAARQLALTILAEHQALLETVAVTHQARPEIDPLELMLVSDRDTGATGNYQIASWKLGLAPGELQSTSAATRRIEVE